ncbi:hypothetical protein A2Y99_02850, partial [Candidatus Gottesmanbacteria bacterium RBG_13_37_7]
LFKISKGFISWDWIVKSWQEVGKHDVIMINLPQFEGVVPAIAGRILGKKVVSIYHCEVILPNGLWNKIIQVILDISNFTSLFFSESVITYTKDFADNSRILPYFIKKLQYVYPPIIKPKIDKRVQKMIKQKIGKRPQYIIGVAARLAAEKGIEYLFEAIPEIESRIKNDEFGIREAIKTPRMVSRSNRDSSEVEETKIKIVVAGSLDPVGEAGYKEKILKLVEKYKKYIIFLGELNEEEMGSFYSLIDVLVLPSINSTEAFGMVQVEAMMMGVPVIATDLPGVRVPIQKTHMGLISPIKNANMLGKSVAEVLINRDRYISSDCRIEDEFSIKNTIKFYQKLLQS